MPFDYTDLQSCQDRVLVRTEIQDTTGAIATEIGYKLEESAGTANTITYYRPHYVAAVMLMQSRGDQTVTSADGAKFFGERKQWNLQPVIESMLREQQALDKALGLEIPEGFQVDDLLNALCGCSGEGESATSTAMSILVG